MRTPTEYDLNIISTISIVATAFIANSALSASKKASMLALLPFISVCFDGESIANRKIILENIGEKPAYNIKMFSFPILIKSSKTVYRLKFKFSGTNALAPRKTKRLELTGTINGNSKRVPADFLTFLIDPEESHERPEANFVITYRNVLNNHFFIEVRTGKKGLFIGPTKELNILAQLTLFFRKILGNIQIGIYQTWWKLKEAMKNDERK